MALQLSCVLPPSLCTPWHAGRARVAQRLCLHPDPPHIAQVPSIPVGSWGNQPEQAGAAAAKGESPRAEQGKFTLRGVGKAAQRQMAASVPSAYAGMTHGLVSCCETWQIHSILGLLPALG